MRSEVLVIRIHCESESRFSQISEVSVNSESVESVVKKTRKAAVGRIHSLMILLFAVHRLTRPFVCGTWTVVTAYTSSPSI